MVHTWSTACLRADPQGPGISKSVPPCGSPFHKSLTDVPRPWLRHRNVGAAAVAGQPVSFFE